ncbi:E3 ubiquitin-protein ligase listerin isoform X2 [Athalia rosae]|uniref:E3 ubiquitin-protein ligase listerin isoform X2 n=1 Tax=Athalia rosae TaxID=37344 RepID=UPI002033EB95|nr:E3 ubiquitin-protein ligase listerin isoform X2 [Athalia rosae]
MGKNKQAQRTKNNARPSSSGRSAELLSASKPHFVSLLAVKDSGYDPILPGLTISTLDEIDVSKLDSNFQLLLKKMNKKDATTKLKALQEFTVLCNNSTPLTVRSVLPFWPRIYCVLAIDVNHRVREATHIAHLAVVKPVGRNIAPYLKQLAGPWFTSQYDTYAPAASAASNAFQEIFPPKKSTDAIVHCQEEILNYIHDNITIQTPQTLGNKKTGTPEEMEIRYQRLLISSLQGYSLYLKSIPVHQLEKVANIHANILSSNKFWKLAKHEVPLIRAGFFSVLAAMIQYTDELYKNEKKKLITAIMNNLDETDPGVSPVVWEAVLFVIHKIKNWHNVVSIEKLILPKLWRVLRDGGHGSASSIYPNLLPLISHFQLQNVDRIHLYTNFFDNLRKGFKVKSVQLSHLETLAVVTAFTECLRYVIHQNSNNQILCETLFQQQLVPALEWCLTKNSLIKQLLSNQITQLVCYWSKNREVADYKSYSYLVQQFWAELEAKLLDSLESTNLNFDAACISETHDSLIDLLLGLRNTSLVSRKHLRVKFFDPNEKVEKDEVVPQVANDDALYHMELAQLINKIASVCFASIEEDSSGIFVQTFYKLVFNFGSKDLLDAVVQSDNTGTSLFSIYDKHLKQWLIEKPKHIGIIMKLLFSIIKYFDESEKNAVLASIAQIDNEIVLRYGIEYALSKRNRGDPVVIEWISQTKVSTSLVEIAKQIATSDSTTNFNTNKNVLMLCFECQDNGDLIVGERTFECIVSILCNGVTEQSNKNSNALAELLSDLCMVTWSHKQPGLGAIKIVEALFQLSCRDDLDGSDFHVGNTVQNTWKLAVVEFINKLSSSKLLGLTKKCANILWEKIFKSKDILFTEKLVEVAATFITAMMKDGNQNALMGDVVMSFTSGAEITTWLSSPTTVVLYGEVVSGNLLVMETSFETQIGRDFIKVDLERKYPIDDIENCVKWAFFNIILLKKMFTTNRASEDIDEAGSNQIESMDTSKNTALPTIKDTLANILHVIAVGYLYSRHYASTKHYNSISTLLANLREEFKHTYTLLEPDVRESILRLIFENSRTNIGIWPYVLHLYCTELAPCTSLATYFKRNFSTLSSESSGTDEQAAYLHAVQVLPDYVNMADVPLELYDYINVLVIERSLLRDGSDEGIVQSFIATLDKMIKLYQEDSGFLLFGCDVSRVSWQELRIALEVIRFLRKTAATIPLKLNNVHWDFILISLASWQLSVNKSRQDCDNLQVTAFIVAVNQLFRVIQALLYKHEEEPIKALPLTMLDEWKNIFADDVHIVVIETWMYCSDLYNQHDISSTKIILLDNLGEALKLVDNEIFFKQQSSATLAPINSGQVIELSCKWLQSPVPSLQLSAYQALKKVIPELVSQDKTLIESENFNPNSLNIKKFEHILAATQSIVNAMLLDFKLCETVNCTIQPYTDSYIYTLGYLFTWAILLDMCSHAHAELRYQYSESLKDDFFPCLLNNLFRLMPVEVFHDNKNKAARLIEIFSTSPLFSFAESWTEWRLDHLVCWLYADSLRQLPVLVRQWWGAADSRVSAVVDRITTLYVSPMLCQEELQCNKLTNIENMQVKIHPTAREVIALYQVEDAKLELSIVLPVNHPLGPVTVEPGQHAGGGAQWRNCHMQLSIFLTHQV